MQPITLHTSVISDLIDKWENVKTQRAFHKLAENLENYHQVYIDKNENGSRWFKNFREIRNQIQDQNLRKLFDELLGPRNITYCPVAIDNIEEYLYEITKLTPDKIGIDQLRRKERDVVYYDLNLFNSNDLDLECFLYRLPKTLHIPPGYLFNDVRILTPYIRDAKKIEFCDLFLFKNPQYKDDVEYIFKILQHCNKLNKVEIHCEPNKLNILQKQVDLRLKQDYGKDIFSGFKKYNPPTKDVNHDRFIIIDTNKISIRFTTSFNNFRRTSTGGFKVKDSFLIEFSSGRKYYD